MRLDGLYLSGIGVHRPGFFPAEKAVELGLYDEADFIENGLTGAWVAGETPAPDMAVHAARQCLSRAGDHPGEVDLLLHATVFPQGPEVWLPAPYVQQQVLGSGVPAMEVRQGCNGMLAALALGGCFLQAAPARRAALLTSADNFSSPVMDRWRSCPGFLVGDAASAVLLTKRPGFARLAAVDSATIPELEPLHRGDEPLFPPGATAGRMVDLRRRGEYFREHGMPLVDVVRLVAKAQGELVDRVLAEAGTRLADITRMAYVNAARYLTEQWFTGPLGVPLSRSTWDFGRGVGHAGACDQILSLDHLVNTGQVGPGDRVLLAGLAPGMSIAAAVVEIISRPAWTQA